MSANALVSSTPPTGPTFKHVSNKKKQRKWLITSLLTHRDHFGLFLMEVLMSNFILNYFHINSIENKQLRLR